MPTKMQESKEERFLSMLLQKKIFFLLTLLLFLFALTLFLSCLCLIHAMATDYWGWKRKIKHLVKYLVPTMHWKGKFPTGEVQRKMKLSQVFSKQHCLENIFPSNIAWKIFFQATLHRKIFFQATLLVWCGVATMFRKFYLSVFQPGNFRVFFCVWKKKQYSNRIFRR